MATAPFLGEIKIMSFNFAPKGWAMCNGQLLSIQQNTALFSLFGTAYGGNGVSTFALPNLQGLTPAGVGKQFNVQGMVTGEATHTLLISEVPSHTHPMAVSTTGPLENATGRNPQGTIPAQQALIAGSPVTPVQIWGTGPMSTTFNPTMVAPVGGNPHENRQPYLAINFCVALQGIFPSRN